ncbi:MAG: terminase [Candidatus Acidiferrum sp.]
MQPSLIAPELGTQAFAGIIGMPGTPGTSDDPRILAEFAADIASFTHDPEGFALYNYPWGEGELEGVSGPRKFQRQILNDIRVHLSNPETRYTPLRIAIGSGHGIGKTALFALITGWGLGTCEDCRIVMTANTGTQLQTKTAPELAKWFRIARNADWFQVAATSIKSTDPGHEKTWRADLIPWNDANPQATAGTHNKGKRIIILFDEASEIPEVIWETVSGALTDEETEILWIAAGQRTQSTGAFHECFESQAHRWKTYSIDSRDVEGTNKELFAQWIEDWGLDSDYVRVRVLGLPPRASDVQFIDSERIRLAQGRPVTVGPDEPLIAGVDMAWGGDDHNVIRFRRGKDAASIPPIRVPGEKTRNPDVMTMRLAEVLSQTWGGRKVHTMFVDSAGIAGNVVSKLRQLGHSNVIEVNFGADAPDPKYANMRAYMWGKMKDWLLIGSIEKAATGLSNLLPSDLAAPGYRIRARDTAVVLEEKKDIKARLGRSPDDGDALALTFPFTVAIKPQRPTGPKRVYSPWS